MSAARRLLSDGGSFDASLELPCRSSRDRLTKIIAKGPGYSVGFRFTQFVAGLDAETPPDTATFEGALVALRKILIYEMRRRGLWHAPPRYLGVLGGESWREPELLDELTLDCYEFIFVRRLNGLVRRAMEDDIESLIFVNVQHFLHETQRRHDPLGYRVFEIVLAATRKLVEVGMLYVLAGDPKIRNDTVLGFEPWLEGVAGSLDVEPIERWNDVLMPDLATAWRREQVVSKTAEQIAGLATAGVLAFAFRDILTPLKDDARRRWLALLFDQGAPVSDEVEGEVVRVSSARLDIPRYGFEDQEIAEELLACLQEGIDRTAKDRKSKNYLQRLLTFLWRWSAALEEEVSDGKLPSDRQLSKLLSIPRARLQGLMTTLSELATSCSGRRKADLDDLATSARGEGSRMTIASQEVMAMEGRDRRNELRLRTRSTFQQTRTISPNSLSKGDLVSFSTAAEAVDWLLLERHGKSVRLAAVDDRPWIGSRDTSIHGDEPRVVRGGQIITLDAEVLSQAELVDTVGDQEMARVWRRLDANSEPTPFELEVDQDSHYLAWMERLAAAASRLSSPSTAHPRLSVRRSTDSWPRNARLLAAVLALATLGLGILAGHLQNQLRRGSEAVVLPTRIAAELRIGSDQRSVRLHPLAEKSGQQLVYLVFRNAPVRTGYRLRLLDPESRQLWKSGTLTAEEHLLVLPLPKRLDGMRLEVSGVAEDGSEDVLQHFDLGPPGLEGD